MSGEDGADSGLVTGDAVEAKYELFEGGIPVVKAGWRGVVQSTNQDGDMLVCFEGRGFVDGFKQTRWISKASIGHVAKQLDLPNNAKWLWLYVDLAKGAGYKWMHADLWAPKVMTTMNPTRWSKRVDLEELVADFEAREEKKEQRKVRIFLDGTIGEKELEFTSYEEALIGLRMVLEQGGVAFAAPPAAIPSVAKAPSAVRVASPRPVIMAGSRETPPFAPVVRTPSPAPHAAAVCAGASTAQAQAPPRTVSPRPAAARETSPAAVAKARTPSPRPAAAAPGPQQPVASDEKRPSAFKVKLVPPQASAASGVVRTPSPAQRAATASDGASSARDQPPARSSSPRPVAAREATAAAVAKDRTPSPRPAVVASSPRQPSPKPASPVPAVRVPSPAPHAAAVSAAASGEKRPSAFGVKLSPPQASGTPRPASPQTASPKPASPRPASPRPASAKPASPRPASPRPGVQAEAARPRADSAFGVVLKPANAGVAKQPAVPAPAADASAKANPFGVALKSTKQR